MRIPVLLAGAVCAALLFVPGGFPLVEKGHLIGAIGVSGGTGAQDSVVATAGVNSVK